VSGHPECREVCHVQHKGRSIQLTKDAPERDWYIIVEDAGGYCAYDGYWCGSEDKTVADALEQAKFGACLDD